MKLRNTLNVSLILGLGLLSSAAQSHPAASVAGLSVLPQGFEFATDAVGNIQTFQLIGEKTGLTSQKVGVNLKVAARTGILSTMFKQMKDNESNMPALLDGKGREALARSGIAVTANQLYLSKTFQHLVRSTPWVGHYLACECEGICENCKERKEVALTLIDVAINFAPVPKAKTLK